MNYYNDNDPRAAAWLRALIENNLIPPGHVDDRSISEIQAADLAGFAQCHFFAGIAGWSVALSLAGWPADRPVWTGSCPCQPFSQAGKRRGTADERHLWPEFARLIGQCRPPVVFGEQVASADGRQWLSGVFADVEALGYAAAGSDLCAAGIGAPHIRQRLYWVADAAGGAGAQHEHQPGRSLRWTPGPHDTAKRGGDIDGLADAGHQQARWPAGPAEKPGGRAFGDASGCSDADGLADATGARCDGAQRNAEGDSRHETRMLLSSACGEAGGLADAGCECDVRRGRAGDMASAGGGVQGPARERQRRGDAAGYRQPTGSAAGSVPASFWSDSRLITCRDGKTRRIPAEPALFPLADGIQPARMAALRGAGNAIVPQVAAEFIAAWLEVEAERSLAA